MPWKETAPVLERHEFVRLAGSGRYPFSELCRLFGISRKTGYKQLRRYEEGGWDALEDRPRAAHSHPNATDEELVEQLIKVRRAHPSWGPVKILDYLEPQHPEIHWPAASTVGEILDRAGLVKKRRRRRRITHPGRPLVAPALEPNLIWNIDYKGQFRTGNRTVCYPLTATDSFTRTLLLCQGFRRPTYLNTRAALQKCFSKYGLPQAIRSDNGEPFVSCRSLGGLSRLGVWLTKLGIQRIRTRPGCPQDNGIHERMHRTLKDETTRPPASSIAAQQKLFDRFCTEYNTVRPHEALSGKTPMSLYSPSPRTLPRKLPQMEYPGHFEVRTVRVNGDILWKGRLLFLSEVLGRERVGLEETADAIWSIYFGTLLIGIFNERERKIAG